MAKKKSILSRFFKSDAESDSKSEPEFEKDTEPESRQESQDSENSSSLPDPSLLRLESDHPINKLWRIHTESSPWLPAPALRLAAPPGTPEVLSPDETAKELSRLLFAVSSTANKRLIRTSPPKDEKTEPTSSDMDAEVVVFITHNNLTAWLLIYPPVGGGREVDCEMVRQALQKSEVRFGVDKELLKRLPGDTNRYFHLHLIAQGEPPVHGQDGHVEDLFSRNVNRQAKINESGKIDYAELNLIQNVKEGETICRIFPPVAGRPGRSVSNQSIPPKEGKPAVVPTGRNTKISDDGSCLLATLTGRVEFSGRSFHVKPVLDIKGNVDYSTGNINFVGDVDIQGDVCSGFNVKALGNITVSGVVEACKVEAGGDLILQKGVKGDMQAVIQAQRNIYAKYLESCTIYVRENLQSDCIINSNVYSDGSVLVDSGRGSIIGGNIRAAKTVTAKAIGSRAECRTFIGLGGMPSAEFELEYTQQEINELTSILELLQQQPDSPAKLKGLPMIQSKLSVNINKLSQYKETLNELKIQQYVQTHRDERLVCDTAYAGTEISIADASLTLHSETKYCTAALIDGEIQLI